MLIDEPAAGMTPRAAGSGAAHQTDCATKALSIFVVEHDMDMISQICDVVTVLNFGPMLLEGPRTWPWPSDRVRTAYLGGCSRPAGRRSGSPAAPASRGDPSSAVSPARAGIENVELDRSPGRRDRRDARSQRSRQEHDAPCHLGDGRARTAGSVLRRSGRHPPPRRRLVARRGLAHVPEGRRSLAPLTVGRTSGSAPSGGEGVRWTQDMDGSSTGSNAYGAEASRRRAPCPVASSRCWSSVGR